MYINTDQNTNLNGFHMQITLNFTHSQKMVKHFSKCQKCPKVLLEKGNIDYTKKSFQLRIVNLWLM